MTTHNLIHTTFIIMLITTAVLCVIFILKKRNTRKNPKELSKEKFESTLLGEMIDFTNEVKTMFNIWPFVSELKRANLLPKKIDESQLVAKVYRDSDNNFEHILLNTEKENNYIVIIVDLIKKKTKGYYSLDLKNQYNS